MEAYIKKCQVGDCTGNIFQSYYETYPPHTGVIGGPPLEPFWKVGSRSCDKCGVMYKPGGYMIGNKYKEE